MRWTVAVVLVAACGGDPAPHVMMDFARAGSFFDAPFPSDDLRSGATIDVSGFPNPGNSPTVARALEMVGAYDGFATSGGVFFQISEAIDPAGPPGLPDLAGSVAPGAAVFLMSLDDGARTPVDVTFTVEPGPYRAPNQLALVPLQGVPLRASTRYAAVVTTAITTAGGTPLAPAPADALATYGDAVELLAQHGVAAADVAGLAVFTTGDPTAEVAAAVATAGREPLTVTGLAPTDTYPDFCVYQTTVAMPDYQAGEPPFSEEGGDWRFVDGQLANRHTEDARLVVTVPHAPPPPAGYPVVVFSRTGAGGDRPLVDRGQGLEHGGPPIEQGEGPARYLARAGFAAVMVDGPLGGIRNPTGGDEQFLTFNINNLYAMRDNVRESALELALLTSSLGAISFDASACAGVGSAPVGFDTDHVAIMGHSMGAWIAPIAAAFQPDLGAMVLSGAGGSWIANVLYKQKPVPVLSFILVLVQAWSLTPDDPVLTLAQWALEPADPQVYGARAGARHVLMEQGIVDNYILPRIANATSLAMGLDLAGDELDTIADERLADQQPLGPLLPLIGRRVVTLPAPGHVVVQHLEDGIEDGHEILFQTDAPKHQYQCFLASWVATGTPMVDVAAARDAPCP